MSTQKIKFPEFPETLVGAIRYFADPDLSLAFMVSMRWPEGAISCPRCKCEKVSFLKTRRLWKCSGCAKQFSVKVGTIFEDSPLGLDKWLPAVWVIVNAKNGVSSCELARSLGVTQKTAWFMLHRIRVALHDGTFELMTGRVEADETFIGALSRNMHKEKRSRTIKGTGGSGKTAVLGLLERGDEKKHSKVKLEVLKTVRAVELQGHVRKYVLKGSEVLTDKWVGYNGLDTDYAHGVVDHAEAYVKGHVHTNGLENFWSLLKRTVKGTYVAVEPFHLFRYLDEQAFRFNERMDKQGDKGRFISAMAGIFGRRLTYRKLIGADAVGGLPAGAW